MYTLRPGHSRVQILYSNIRYSGLRVDPMILIVHHFESFPPERRACSHIGEVHRKVHATLISTYLVTQIESHC